MNNPGLYRKERIERLIRELQYEIQRGMMEREIDETIHFSFYVPLSSVIPDGVVYCTFQTRPMPRYAMSVDQLTPRLKLVK